MARINSKIEGTDVLGVVSAGETLYMARATHTQFGVVKPSATDFDFDADTNALQVKLGKGLERTEEGIAIIPGSSGGLGDIYGVQFPYGDATVQCDNTGGITITGTMHLYTNAEKMAVIDVGDSVAVLPIVPAADGLHIDASVDQKKAVVSASGITAQIDDIKAAMANPVLVISKI